MKNLVVIVLTFMATSALAAPLASHPQLQIPASLIRDVKTATDEQQILTAHVISTSAVGKNDPVSLTLTLETPAIKTEVFPLPGQFVQVPRSVKMKALSTLEYEVSVKVWESTNQGSQLLTKKYKITLIENGDIASVEAL